MSAPDDPHRSPPPTSAQWNERRLAERAAITLRVDYKRLNTFFADYAKNISHGGTFIRTDKPLEIGTIFVFVLSVPAHSEQIQLEGEVVRVVRVDCATPDDPAGMGIRFCFRNAGERAALDAFVGALMKASLGDRISEQLLARGRQRNRPGKPDGPK